MRKLLLLLLMPFALGACDKDKSEYQTWTIASEKGATGVWTGFGFVPANIIKEGPGEPWRASAAHIEGFTFEEGYQSTILVRVDPLPGELCDGPSNSYTMEKLISRTPVKSVNKDDFSPEIELLVASERGAYYEFPCYWVKDLRYSDPHWEPLPMEISGLTYEPGYEYRLRVKVSAEKDATNRSGYGIRFTQIEELGKTQTSSEGIPQPK